jgi:hypothetical protein
MDLLRLCFNIVDQYPGISPIIPNSAEHFITLILKYHRFEMLPMFERSYKDWIHHIMYNFDEEDVTSKILKSSMFTKSMNPDQCQRLLEFLEKCLLMMTSDEYPELRQSWISPDTFLQAFYYHYCELTDKNLDKIPESLITFLYAKHTSGDIFYTDLYDQRYIMQFDSLVNLILATSNAYRVYEKIIENMHFYSENEIAHRLQFCQLNSQQPHSRDDINRLCSMAILHDNFAALKYLVNQYSINDITNTTTDLYICISFEMFEYLCISNISIHYNIGFDYIIEDVFDITRYFKLFQTLKNDKIDITGSTLINDKSLSRFILQCCKHSLTLKIAQYYIDSITLLFPEFTSDPNSFVTKALNVISQNIARFANKQ